jgi:hypothetical protein
MPPSIRRIVPVVDPASGDAREAIPYATSSALTRRPKGCRRRSASAAASGSSAASRSRATHGVSAVPGATALTRMSSDAWSAAIARVSARTARFASAVESSLADADEGDRGAGVHYRRMR